MDIDLKKKIFNATHIAYIVFLLIQFIPNVGGNDTQKLYSIIFASAIELIMLIVTFAKVKKDFYETAADVTAIIFVVLILWQVLTEKMHILNESMFPSPELVLEQLIEDLPRLGEDIKSSVTVILQGYVLATILGIPLGLIVGWQKRLSNSFTYISRFLSLIPPVVYIPYAIAFMPSYSSVSTFIIFVASFWPIFSCTLSGVGNIDKKIIDSAKVLNVKGISLLTHVILPATLPEIFIGCNQGLGYSFILLTSAEMIGGSNGIGYYIKYYSDFGDYKRILVGILVIGTLISLITFLYKKLQAYLLRWKID